MAFPEAKCHATLEAAKTAARLSASTSMAGHLEQHALSSSFVIAPTPPHSSLSDLRRLTSPGRCNRLLLGSGESARCDLGWFEPKYNGNAAVSSNISPKHLGDFPCLKIGDPNARNDFAGFEIAALGGMYLDW